MYACGLGVNAKCQAANLPKVANVELNAESSSLARYSTARRRVANSNSTYWQNEWQQKSGLVMQIFKLDLTAR